MEENKEINETGVAQLKHAIGNGYSKTVQPWCGEVKWFVDELGQTWTKFKVLDARETHVETHVIPARTVLGVVYNSRPREAS